MKKILFIILFSFLFSSAKEKNDSIKNIFKDNYNTYKKDSIWNIKLSQIKNDFIIDTTHILDYLIIKERIKKIDNLTPINLQYNKEVKKQIDFYFKNRKKLIEQVKEKGEYYFPLFEEILIKNNIPLEFKYLPIVESGLNARAKSPAGAVGLWQFMYSTGRAYNLNISSYVDERSDPYKSTQAACDFLNDLYNIYKDWHLVLAAYNAGPGNVNKAIRRAGGSENFWKIRNYLPIETQKYIPSFIAINYIMSYNNILYKKDKKTEFYKTDTIISKGQISFASLSKHLNIPEKEIIFLNPEYKLNIIPFIKNKEHYIKLPKENIGIFINNEDSIYFLAKKEEKKAPEYFEIKDKIYYKVKKGDCLSIIAEKNKCSTKQIMYWNGLKNTSIRTGQKLVIYLI